MSERNSSENFDSWDEDLTEAEYAELRRTTRAQDRAIIINCSKTISNYTNQTTAEKCINKIKSILRNMVKNGVNLDLVNKWSFQHIGDIDSRVHGEIIADYISKLQRETKPTAMTSTARGIQKRKMRTKKRSMRGSRKRQRKSRRR